MIGIPSVRTRYEQRTGFWKRFRLVLGNIVELATLQFRLAEVDFQKWRAGMAMTVGLLAVGGAFLLGAIPMLVYAAGLGFQAAGFSLAHGLLMACGAFIVAGAGLAFWGWTRFTRSLSDFDRSKAELARNLDWLKGRLADESADKFAPHTNN